ncbi:unnamed protein product [Lactuca saligna]|uniref:Uncharacterized protein n=1 Tax=Lactuca saligna TaxID=75948 RepID=A0AA36EJH8_LACSI|nr:unnamed protein product [Lactuca saligna]
MHMVSSCAVFGYFAEMASCARHQQLGSRPNFLWYSFPRTVGPEIYARRNAKLDWMKQQKVHVPEHFSTLLYKRENIIVDHGMGAFSIPDDTPSGRVPRWVRQRRDPEEDEPAVAPTDEELPMDPYRISRRRFDDNLERSANYTNMSLDHLIEKMHVTRPAHVPPAYPYMSSWEELWREQRGGAGGSGGGGDDGDDEE